MRIDVVYGVHGDERLAIELGRSLEDDPIDGVTPRIANHMAVESGARFIDENMAVSFNEADPDSPIYERREAAKLLGYLASSDAGLVLDTHTMRYADASYVGIGTETHRGALLVAEMMGYKNAVVSNFGLPHHDSRALTLELFETRCPEERGAAIIDLRSKLTTLAREKSLADIAATISLPGLGLDIWSYQDVIYLGDMNPDEAMELTYADGHFGMIARDDADRLGLRTVIDDLRHRPFALNYGSAFLKYGILGEYVLSVGRSRQHNDWRPFARFLNEREINWGTLGLADVS